MKNKRHEEYLTFVMVFVGSNCIQFFFFFQVEVFIDEFVFFKVRFLSTYKEERRDVRYQQRDREIYLLDCIPGNSVHHP